MKLTNEEIIKKLELSLLAADTIRHSDVDEVVMYYQESGEPLSPEFARFVESLLNYELPCGYDELKWPEKKKVSLRMIPFERCSLIQDVIYRISIQSFIAKFYKKTM
jgi:hypothetical protein